MAAEGCGGITIADVNGERAEETAATVAKTHGCKAIGIQCDVTSEPEVESMVAGTVDAFGTVDILVSNAGILIAQDLIDFPPDSWRKVIDVNLVGYFLCAQAAARVMIPQKRGVIIQINSKSGKKGSFRNSAYAAS